MELANHLGNVLVTISDKRIPMLTNGGALSYYDADVVSAQDYYPFGMQIPGRKFEQANSSYRYGFNGKENDNEVKGEGNQQDYGMRIYDGRLGRFLSVDPITKNYPMLTPYQFASNTPIQAIDLDGLEAFYVHGTWSTPNTFAKLSISTVNEITKNTQGAEFKWSGYNSNKARLKAAMALANHVLKYRDPNQPLTLVGHSHGGNVAIMAANILKKRGVQVDNIITINTPVREYQLNEEASKKHANIYQHYDPIQGSGGNSFITPDKVIVLPTILVPIYAGGQTKPTGEVGSAGRMFDNATNIPVPFDRKHVHDSHNTPELWKDRLDHVINPPTSDQFDLKTSAPRASTDNTNAPIIIKP